MAWHLMADWWVGVSNPKGQAAWVRILFLTDTNYSGGKISSRGVGWGGGEQITGQSNFNGSPAVKPIALTERNGSFSKMWAIMLILSIRMYLIDWLWLVAWSQFVITAEWWAMTWPEKLSLYMCQRGHQLEDMKTDSTRDNTDYKNFWSGRHHFPGLQY